MPGSAPTTDAAASAPLTLRPGCPVLLRDDDTVQVGLQHPLAVRLPRHPDVLALLRTLEAGGSDLPRSSTASAALHALRVAELLVPDDPSVSPVARTQFGPAAADRAARRHHHRVGVLAEDPIARTVDDLLTQADLPRDDRAPTVTLVVAPGPVHRPRIDPLQRAGAPYLVVSGTAGGHRLGPFVEPGATACLRCVDAEEAAADPRLPLLLEQASQAVEPPSDPILEQLALSWAVRDLARWAEGDQPSTWSATVDIGPTRAPEVTPRLRHPHCGCAWDTLLQLP